MLCIIIIFTRIQITYIVVVKITVLYWNLYIIVI